MGSYKKENRITDARYDEYFSDSESEITNPELKEYYKQSKYNSRIYSNKSEQNFIKLSDTLSENIVSNQS